MLLIFYCNVAFPQVGINADNSNPDNSAMLDVKSTAKGILFPRMTTSQRLAVISPAEGLFVYDTDLGAYHYYHAGAWLPVTTGSTGWQLTGNSGLNLATNFIGTIDNSPLVFRVNNEVSGKIEPSSWGGNTSIGYNSLFSNNTGCSNVAMGAGSLYSNTTASNLVAIGDSALFYNGSGPVYFYGGFNNTAVGSKALFYNGSGSGTSGASHNTAVGYKALYSNTFGENNTAIGSRALYANLGINNTANGSSALTANTSGSHNTAHGAYALSSNTTGSNNTASGDATLNQNSTGSNNTATGSMALNQNTTGSGNTVAGGWALAYNNTGSSNTANGISSLFWNTSGYSNVGIGAGSLFYNTTASNLVAVGDSALYSNGLGAVGNQATSNTAIGSKALYSNTTGSRNTALGKNASYNSNSGDNTSIGYFAGNNFTFSSCTFLGSFASPNANGLSNCMALGYNAVATASDRVVIGNTAITSIGGYAGWTTFPSDASFKKNVRENVPGLDFIRNLRPVTYNIDVNAIGAKLNAGKETSPDDGDKARVESPEERESEAAKSRIVYSGFIAQEVEAAARKAGYDFSGVDVPRDADGFYGLRYAEFVVPLVKGMQEQQSVIESQQRQIDELKQLVGELSRKINENMGNKTTREELN